MFQVKDHFLHLLYLLQNKIPFCFAHFNDGEMQIMTSDTPYEYIARGQQKFSLPLKERLMEAFLINNRAFFRGIPCPACH